MPSKRILTILLALMLLSGIIASLFLPHFETFSYSFLDFSGTELSSRPNPQQTGFFGGGYYTTFNGFGSIYALFNVIVSLILTATLCFKNPGRKILKILRLSFIFSLLFLVFINHCVNPYVLTPPDDLLIGFYVMTACEISLFILASQSLRKNN